MTIPPIILASASPRRRAFLEMLGLSFTIQVADIDESPMANEGPEALVCRLSREKAAIVARHNPNSLVIAADTIVVLDNQILGKPVDEADAVAMLRRLRHREHDVISAVSLLLLGRRQSITDFSRTMVTMRNYTEVEIETYVASGDPLDKAGGYAIQNAIFAPVAKISGCYAGVVGLPLGVLADGLTQFGITLDQLETRCQRYNGYPCCLSSA